MSRPKRMIAASSGTLPVVGGHRRAVGAIVEPKIPIVASTINSNSLTHYSRILRTGREAICDDLSASCPPSWSMQQRMIGDD